MSDAPTSLPEAAADWLLGLATAVESADKKDLATAIRAAVDQFRLR